MGDRRCPPTGQALARHCRPTAVEYVERFRQHDERVLANQYPVYDDEAALLQSAKESRADLERLFQADVARNAKG